MLLLLLLAPLLAPPLTPPVAPPAALEKAAASCSGFAPTSQRDLRLRVGAAGAGRISLPLSHRETSQ